MTVAWPPPPPPHFFFRSVCELGGGGRWRPSPTSILIVGVGAAHICVAARYSLFSSRCLPFGCETSLVHVAERTLFFFALSGFFLDLSFSSLFFDIFGSSLYRSGCHPLATSLSSSFLLSCLPVFISLSPFASSFLSCPMSGVASIRCGVLFGCVVVFLLDF